MPEFYKILPSKYKWTGIRIMPWSEAKKLLPPRDFCFNKKGVYFRVRKHGGIVIKTSRNDRPMLDETYRRDDLTRIARVRMAGGEMEDLKKSLPVYNETVLEAYIRAKVEMLSFERLCISLGHPFMVEQSAVLTWGGQGSDLWLRVLLLQPYVRGRTIRDLFPLRYFMLFRPKAGLEIGGRFKHLIPVIGPQLRYCIESQYVDVTPKNFICDKYGSIVYVDYQPERPMKIHFGRFDKKLREWGY